MQYQGGKFLAAKHIVAAMLQNGATTDKPVIEPFCGGCSVTVALCKAGFRVQASDINPSLILLWQKALLEDLQPFELDNESYQRWKTAPDSAEKALAGFGASYAGKWFGGYSRTANKPPYAHIPALVTAVNKINKQAITLRGRAQFECLPYSNLQDTEGAVYYLDPPYAGVMKHSGILFNHEAFWQWARERAQRNFVFVSEYQAPFGRVVMERVTPLGLANGKNGAGHTQTERLFLL